LRYFTPTARLPSKMIDVACACVSTRKLAQLAQLDAGFDYFSMFCAA